MAPAIFWLFSDLMDQKMARTKKVVIFHSKEFSKSVHTGVILLSFLHCKCLSRREHDFHLCSSASCTPVVPITSDTCTHNIYKTLTSDICVQYSYQTFSCRHSVIVLTTFWWQSYSRCKHLQCSQIDQIFSTHWHFLRFTPFLHGYVSSFWKNSITKDDYLIISSIILPTTLS